MKCCIKTTQIVHNNLYFSSIFAFSVNYVEYCNMKRIAMYCDILYLDAYLTVKSLPTPNPNVGMSFFHVEVEGTLGVT